MWQMALVALMCGDAAQAADLVEQAGSPDLAWGMRQGFITRGLALRMIRDAAVAEGNDA